MRFIATVLFVLLSCCFLCINCKKILLVPAQVTSHCFELEAISRGLRQNGHEVYIVLSRRFPKADKVIERGLKPLYFDEPSTVVPVDVITGRVFDMDFFEIGEQTSQSVSQSCDAQMHDKTLMKTIKDMKFDLAIVDGFILSFCNLLLPYAQGIPFVFEFASIMPWTAGVPILPSIHPIASINPEVTEIMTFKERIVNLFWAIAEYSFLPFSGRKDMSLLKEFAPELKSWEELAHKSELFFNLRDHLLEVPTISMPHYIQVPGITVNPAKPLPAEFEKIMKSSSTGVILVSFGSLANNMPEEMTDKLIESFNRVKYTVIWKFSGKSFEQAKARLGEHVHLFKWIPQNDLLGHPKTHVFVTHCGNNGQHESLYHAVPMVGMPIFAEQFHNAFRIMNHGFGVSLLPGGILDFKVDDFVNAMNEVASNSSYKTAITKRSDILKDNPMNPGETTTFWLEHILKFGADHLKPKTISMPWYQYFMIDVLAFILFIILTVVALIYSILRMCYRKLTNKSKVKQQ